MMGREQLFSPDRRDIRGLGNTSPGEIMERFRRGVHYGEEGAKGDDIDPRLPADERIRVAASYTDKILMDNNQSPADKFIACAVLMGYISETYGGWTRCHVPMQVVARG